MQYTASHNIEKALKNEKMVIKSNLMESRQQSFRVKIINLHQNSEFSLENYWISDQVWSVSLKLWLNAC